MDAVLLDTDVFSILMKGTDARAALYKPHVKGKTIALSFVTVGELFAWSVKRGWGATKISDLERRIKTAVIVPYDLNLCRQFGQIKAEMLKVGRTVPSNDLWIAACALRHSIPLVTHNAKDFAGIPGLKVITEVEPPKPQKTAGLFPSQTPPDEK
jgi:predicted nucleic acid-binding protein